MCEPQNPIQALYDTYMEEQGKVNNFIIRHTSIFYFEVSADTFIKLYDIGTVPIHGSHKMWISQLCLRNDKLPPELRDKQLGTLRGSSIFTPVPLVRDNALPLGKAIIRSTWK